MSQLITMPPFSYKKTNDDIKVSVVCLVYNHEKYLREMLDGLVIQKTNFMWEAIIHDDASTDGSVDIIREYEVRYPTIIKPIYQSENKFQKVGFDGIYNCYIPYVKGKYIAFCEGDDYWCDSNKLQMQYDIMEANSNIALCTHKVQRINEDGTIIKNGVMPQKKIKLTRDTELINEKLSTFLFTTGSGLHANSYFVREDIIRSGEYKSLLHCIQGGIAIVFTAFLFGSVYYIHKTMSCYRCMSIGSWTNRQKQKSGDKITEYHLNLSDGLILLDKMSNSKYRNDIYQQLFKKLFYLIVCHKQYKRVSGYIKHNSLKFKPKYNKSLFLFFVSVALLYMPWLCRAIGIIYRAYGKIRNRGIHR